LTAHRIAHTPSPTERKAVSFQGSMFMVIVDAHSKWLEVVPMSTTTTEKTMEVLLSMFARYGIPQQLVTDNGPQFTATEFDIGS